jgi:hypothetical protein
MRDFIEKLKLHLELRKPLYHEVNSWGGNSETGFYTEEHFDFDKMLEEIDAFSATFKKGA